MHGHSYKLEVILKGSVIDNPGHSSDGMVMDFGDLSNLVKTRIIDKVDHQDLNEVYDFRPTAENLLMEFWKPLSNIHQLHALRLWETENAYAEITADG